jgi:SAM-dependent MidA family methyltransferase
MQDPAKLPAPTADEQAHSAQLAQLIREEIARAGGAIDFARYMALALYAPGLGYYSAGKTKFGAAGDFVTAPEISPLFARCLAVQCAQVLHALGGGDVLEVGAGSGRLALDLLTALDAQGALPNRYLILELSADLRARQTQLLHERAPQLAARVRWLSELPADFRGAVIANELLDAMPVERFRVGAHGIEQMQVCVEDDRFVWNAHPAPAALAAQVSPLDLPVGYVSEINPQAQAWVASIAARLTAGVVLLIDYGFPRAEFYHPQRSQGTLMCHYRHRAHGDPLILVGLQDITAHVDFTAIAEAGRDAGLTVLGYTSQAAFLLALGLTRFAEETPDDTRARLSVAQQIKTLTLPSEMGELFKVIALGRGVEPPLLGFTLQDRRGRI